MVVANLLLVGCGLLLVVALGLLLVGCGLTLTGVLDLFHWGGKGE